MRKIELVNLEVGWSAPLPGTVSDPPLPFATKIDSQLTIEGVPYPVGTSFD